MLFYTGFNGRGLVLMFQEFEILHTFKLHNVIQIIHELYCVLVKKFGCFWKYIVKKSPLNTGTFCLIS